MKKKLLNLLGIFVLASSAQAQLSQNQIQQNLRNELENLKFIGSSQVNIRVNSQYQTKHNGVTHVYVNQQLNGLEILNAQADLHFTKEGKLIVMHHNFIPNAVNRVTNNQVSLNANEALLKGLASEGIVIQNISNKSLTLENGKYIWMEPSISSEKLSVQEGYLAVSDELKKVYQVEFLNNETNDWWNKKVDAKTGEILGSLSYTTHCNFPANETAEAHAKHGFNFEDEPAINLGKKASTGSYNVFPLPIESPAKGNRSIMSNMADPASSPFGWHDTNGVAGPEFLITRGNNVWAKEDTSGTNNISGFSPNGGDSLIFDYPYAVGNRPRDNRNAAIVNLFYWNNIIHDIFFNYGFDEKSGNFQQKNFTNEGLGRDFVLADAQDGSGTSNANFSTPTDGNSGRMQMFLWPTSGASASNNTLGVTYPSSIKGKYFGPQSAVGARLSPTGLPGKVVLLRDSNATTNFGCGLIANGNELVGNIALIERGGSCGTMSSTNRAKIKRAQEAGAIGVILAHNTNGITPTAVTGIDNSITIPSIFVGFGTGVMLKTALSSDSVYVILFDSSDFNTAIIYDSDLDNGVIAHEYGHGISTRLTGGPNNSSCLGNQEQAGEGWSDFFALALTTRTWENGNNASRGIGTWLISQDTNGVGIRNYRYSRSMTINPVTYNSVKTLSVPHGVGSVWCSMLYDIYWNMIDKYGYDPDWYNGTGGNNKTMQLVIDGLKLQKCSPGFADARDAIILADSLNNNGANRDLLWKAFARRGLGYSAIQGSTNSRLDGTQEFDLPPDVTGLNQLNLNSQLSLYPNPTQSYFIVDVFGGSKINSVDILDLNGKLIQTYKNHNNHLPSATVKLDAYEAGYYLVRINTTDGVGYKKLLIN
jgi:hypothetical protein